MAQTTQKFKQMLQQLSFERELRESDVDSAYQVKWRYSGKFLKSVSQLIIVLEISQGNIIIIIGFPGVRKCVPKQKKKLYGSTYNHLSH